MRIADIIKLNDRDPNGEKKFSYLVSQTGRENDELKKGRLDAKSGSSDEDKDMEGLYQRYLTEISSIFDRAMEDFRISPVKGSVQELTRELVDKLLLSNINIIDFFMKSDGDNYLYNHSVNVSLLSVMLGVWLNYNKSDLNQLAIAALLHDIGMIKVLRLAMLPRRLSSSERREVEEHPNYSREFVARISGIDNRVVEAVGDHHRRLDTSSRAIDEYPQVIGLVDTFEAMTHPRAYKKPLKPHFAIRRIIDELKGKFDLQIIKALVDNIGLYPPGTWVRLDTEEIGLVIDTNSGLPLSPKVNILFNQEEEVLSEPRTVDLSKQKSIHIKGLLEKEVEHRLQEAFS